MTIRVPRWLVVILLIVLFIVWTIPVLVAGMVYLILRRLKWNRRSTTRTGRR